MTAYTSNIEVTVSDVYTMSGTNPDITSLQNIIQQASFMIETLTGVPFKSAEREFEISTADAAWVKKATVFQSIWLLSQVDPLERQSVSSISQDGLSLQAPDSLTFVLAPMAKRALKNCSWTKSGTMQVAPPSVAADVEDFLVSDAHGGWTPIAGV